MSNVTQLWLALLAGAVLGGFYFGSLWWVVRRISTRKHPELWLLSSFLLRTSLTLAGFYLLMGGRWERAVAGLVGFLVARTALVQVSVPVARFSPHAGK